MSEPTTAATDTSVQNPPATPPATPPAPATPPPAAAQAKPEAEPAWLNERLERERKTLLKQLGVENVDDAKKALTDFKARQEADKTEAQKNAEKLAELDKVKARAAMLEETTRERAQREFAILTDSQKAAVVKLAGDDPAQQLRAIDVLSPTWAAAQTPTSAAPAETAKSAAPAITAPPATTAHPRTAPADTTTSQLTPREQYELLRKTEPLRAVAYLNAHAKEIYPSA